MDYPKYPVQQNKPFLLRLKIVGKIGYGSAPSKAKLILIDVPRNPCH